MIELPKHKNPRNRTSKAPYNFVPLPETVVPAVDDAGNLPDHDKFIHEGYPHSGYFEVDLTTRSPLFIRAALTRDELVLDEEGKDRNGNPVGTNTRYADRVKNKPQFFYTANEGQPVIPGSSLRGMLRTLLEIVSYGKISKVTNKNLVYRAVGDPTSLGAWYREQLLGENQADYPNMRFDYPSPNLKGGYLRRYQGGWAIQPAKEFSRESFVHVDYSIAEPIIKGRDRRICHKVFVKPVGRTSPPRGKRPPGGLLTLNLAVLSNTGDIASHNDSPAPAGMVEAILVESGHIGKRIDQPPKPHQKHMHCAIYTKNDAATPIMIPREMWEAYEEDREMTRGIATRKLCNEGEPLFYLLGKDNRLIFFGPTMMFRLPYKRSILDLIPVPLREPLTLDYADALFGYVREKDDFAPNQALPKQGEISRAYASRVSITDAMLVDESIAPDNLLLTGRSDRPITPRILSNPKPTTFQHYLVQEASEKPDLSHYDSPQEDMEGILRGKETVIRGHKLYWHRGSRTTDDIRARHPQEDPTAEQMSDKQFFRDRFGNWQVKEQSTQHTQMLPLREGVQFKFFIHFENLSDTEMGALCWILNPYGEESDYCHSLGMGKPLGLGAVKLSAQLHMVDRKARYRTLFAGDGWQLGIDSQGLSLTSERVYENYVKPFEDKILEQLKLKGRCQRLREVKRIGMLLKMLRWPGPDIEHTNYLHLEHFRDRPVLPDASYYFEDLKDLAEPGMPAKEPAPAAALVAPVVEKQPVKARQFNQPAPRPQVNTTPARPVTTKERVKLLDKVANSKAKIVTAQGEECICSNFPYYVPANSQECWAEITRQPGKPLQAVFKKWV